MPPMIGQSEPICCACHKFPSIPNSHAIPRAFFKQIAKENNGNFIVLSDGSTPARRTTDNSKAHILCKACEHEFGVKFDEPIVDAVRKIRAAYNAGLTAVRFDNGPEVCRAIASVLWWCSRSDSKFYRMFKPSRTFESMLETDWRNNREREISYRLDPLMDTNSPIEGGFTTQSLEKFITFPRLHGVTHGYAKRRNIGFGTVFIIGGVLVTVAAPRLSPTRERRSGYLQSNGKLTLRGVSIWDVPFLKEFLVQAVQKERQHCEK